MNYLFKILLISLLIYHVNFLSESQSNRGTYREVSAVCSRSGMVVVIYIFLNIAFAMYTL